MKNLMILALICLVALPSLAISQSGAQTTSYKSFATIERSILVAREKGDGQGNGPHDPIPNVNLSVETLADLDNIDSHNRALISYREGDYLYVGMRLYGPEKAMRPGQSWYLTGVDKKKGLPIEVTDVIQNGRPEKNGRIRIPFAPGDYDLNFFTLDGGETTWGWPLWSCLAYGVVGDWDYHVTVLTSGEMVTRTTKAN